MGKTTLIGQVEKKTWRGARVVCGPPNLHLVLLGSAQFFVQQGLTESLAGPFELIRYDLARLCVVWWLSRARATDS